jgi:hypothetical protein
MAITITPAYQTPTRSDVVTLEGIRQQLTSADNLNSINELVIRRAEEIPNTTLIAYPSAEDGNGGWVEYTARDLDSFVDVAAKELTRRGLVPKVG